MRKNWKEWRVPIYVDRSGHRLVQWLPERLRCASVFEKPFGRHQEMSDNAYGLHHKADYREQHPVTGQRFPWREQDMKLKLVEME
jgi:hypothetical protein